MSSNDVSSSSSSIGSGNNAVSGTTSSLLSRVRTGGDKRSPPANSIHGLDQSGSSSSLEVVNAIDDDLSETLSSQSVGNRRRTRKSPSVASTLAGRPRPVSLRLSPEEIAQQWFILEPELVESVPDAPPPGPIDVSKLSRTEIKRQETIYELYVTESDYVASMLVLQRLFIAPLAKHQVLADRERMMLFSNVEQLLPVNQELLSAIQQQRVHDRCVISGLGTLFLKLSHFLKLYNIYCANYTEALSLLQQLLRSNQRFAEFVRDTSARPECGGLDLAGLLIKPVQRLCKYPLFLREVLKQTPPEHNDHEPLEKALELMEKVVQRVNEGRRFLEDQRTMLEIMVKLDFGFHTSIHKASGSLSASFGASSAKFLKSLRKSPAVAALGSKTETTSNRVTKLPSNFHRRLVRQGGLFAVDERGGTRRQKPRLAVLFSDALVLAKPKGIQYQLLSTDLESMRIPLSATQAPPTKSRREQAMVEANANDQGSNSTVFSVKHVVLLTQVLRMTDLTKGKLVRLPIPQMATTTSSDAMEFGLEYALDDGAGSDILHLAFPTPASCASWHQSLSKALNDVADVAWVLKKTGRSESEELLAPTSTYESIQPQAADVDGFLAAYSQINEALHSRLQSNGREIHVIGAYAPPTPMTDSVDVSILKGVPPAPKRRPPPPVPPPRLSLKVDHQPRRRSLTDSALPELVLAQVGCNGTLGVKTPSSSQLQNQDSVDLEETIKAHSQSSLAPVPLPSRPPSLPPSPVSLASQQPLDNHPPNPFWSPLDPADDNLLKDSPNESSHHVANDDDDDDDDYASVVIPTVVTPAPASALTPSPSTGTFIGVSTVSRTLVITGSSEGLHDDSGFSGDAHQVVKLRRASIVRPARQSSNSSFGKSARQESNASIDGPSRQESQSSIGTTGSGHLSNASLHVPDQQQQDSAPVRPSTLGRPQSNGAPSPRLARVSRKTTATAAHCPPEQGPQLTHADSPTKKPSTHAEPPSVVVERTASSENALPMHGPGRVRALKMQFQATGTVPIVSGARPENSVPRRPSQPVNAASNTVLHDDTTQTTHHGSYAWVRPSEHSNMSAELKATVSSRLRASTEELAGSTAGRQSPNLARRLRQTTAPGQIQS